MIALGGAAASIAIGLIAPRVASWQVEFPETLVGCALLALPALYPKHWVRRVATVALVVVLILLAAGLLRVRRKGVIQQARSFYGALTVTEENLFLNRYDPMRVLYHGGIQHGTQFLAPELQKAPTTYYAPRSGVGQLLHARLHPWNVGVIGLGAGTLAVYGRPYDSFTFYEIDPLVAEVAQSKFSYLKDSRARVKIAIGDGRLSLEKEAPQQLNLLVIDAFSGDSIPTHLLTREAFELYFSKLKADGVIAIHISNKFVDLRPVLAGVADALDKQAVLIHSFANSTRGAYQSDWVLIANGIGAFRDLPPATMQALPPLPPGFQVWTDDYSNILQLLR